MIRDGNVKRTLVEARDFVVIVLILIVSLAREFIPDAFAKYIPNNGILVSIALVICAVAAITVINTNILIRTRSSGVPLRRAKLSVALTDAISENRFNSVLIYAISSQHIHGIISSCRCEIDTCKVLLWKPDPKKEQFTQFGQVVDQVIKSGWRSKATKDLVRETTIRRYADRPDIYFVILDRNTAFLGFYRANNDPNYIVDFSEVILLDSKNENEAKVIDWLISQHTGIWGDAFDEIVS